jgi:hypothetical protein
MPDEAIAPIIEHVLHELRRALARPIYRIHKGQVGPVHEFALAQGWFRPMFPNLFGEPSMVALTDLGLKMLAEDQCRNGLPSETTR